MQRILGIATRVLLGSIIVTAGFAQSKAGSTASPISLTGKWSGSFDITPPGGKLVHDRAVLMLHQTGTALTGSIGQSESKQSTITHGSVEGNKLHFVLDTGQGMRLDFDLQLEAGHLRGAATGTVQGQALAAVVDLMSVSASNPSPLSSEDRLRDQVARLDKAMFDAYNRRDLATLKTMFTEDLEFYHDKSGLMTYRQNMDSFKRNFEGRTRMRRELVDGSLEVYPIAGYGAIEIGVHRFYSTDPGQKERLTATAKFVHVWKKLKSGWKVARVMSYDHQ